MNRVLDRLAGRLRSSGDGDDGVTLVELLVVSLISSILLGALGVLFTGSLQASHRASTHTAATAEARLALDVVARRLRVGIETSTGPIFVSATATSMVFHASLSTAGSTADPLPSQVRYEVDTAAKCLRETVTPAAAPVRTQCLAYGEVVPTFSYYQVAKRPTKIAPSPSAVPATPLPLPATGLSATDLPKVGSVGVSLTVRDPRAPAASRPVQVTTRVLLVNDLNEEAL